MTIENNHIDAAFGPMNTPKFELGAELVCLSTGTHWQIQNRYWNPDVIDIKHEWEYELMNESLDVMTVDGFDLSVNYSRVGSDRGDSR